MVEKIENLLVKIENLQIVSLSTYFLLLLAISARRKILYPTGPDPMTFFDIFLHFLHRVSTLCFLGFPLGLMASLKLQM